MSYDIFNNQKAHNSTTNDQNGPITQRTQCNDDVKPQEAGGSGKYTKNVFDSCLKDGNALMEDEELSINSG